MNSNEYQQAYSWFNGSWDSPVDFESFLWNFDFFYTDTPAWKTLTM